MAMDWRRKRLASVLTARRRFLEEGVWAAGLRRNLRRLVGVSSPRSLAASIRNSRPPLPPPRRVSRPQPARCCRCGRTAFLQSSAEAAGAIFTLSAATSPASTALFWHSKRWKSARPRPQPPPPPAPRCLSWPLWALWASSSPHSAGCRTYQQCTSRTSPQPKPSLRSW